MFQIRPYNPNDYTKLASWWSAHKWPVLPEHYLPKTGIIVESNSNPICAGFLYRTDSAFAWLEFVVADPNSDKIERRQGLDLLVAALLDEAQKQGFSAVHTSAQHPSLIDRYVSHGFTVSDTNMTNLTWIRK